MTDHHGADFHLVNNDTPGFMAPPPSVYRERGSFQVSARGKLYTGMPDGNHETGRGLVAFSPGRTLPSSTPSSFSMAREWKSGASSKAGGITSVQRLFEPLRGAFRVDLYPTWPRRTEENEIPLSLCENRELRAYLEDPFLRFETMENFAGRGRLPPDEVLKRGCWLSSPGWTKGSVRVGLPGHCRSPPTRSAPRTEKTGGASAAHVGTCEDGAR